MKALRNDINKDVPGNSGQDLPENLHIFLQYQSNLVTVVCTAIGIHC